MLIICLAVKRSVLSNLDFSDCSPLYVKVSVFKSFMMFARRFSAIVPSANICSFGPQQCLRLNYPKQSGGLSRENVN